MSSIKVKKGGFLTTVQDLGRIGYQKFGMPVAGVMDNFSYRVANFLVGNNEGEAVLEATLLGGMSNKIATPRLSSPRTKIPAGSVGIAGAQTGMYPSETPGGWQLIGRTPLKLYDPDKEPPVMLSAGDYVRYVSVSEEEYLEIKKQVEEGTYEVKVIISEGGDLRE